MALALDGELTTNAAREVGEHLAGCATCRARQAAITRTIAAVQGAYPCSDAPGFTASVMRQVDARRRSRGPRGVWATGLVAAAAACLLVALLPSGEFTARGGTELTAGLSTRNVGFEVYQAGRALENGAEVEPKLGLSFRIFNRSHRATQLSLFGVDARGEVHWFYPAWLTNDDTPKSHAVAATPAVQVLPQVVAPTDVPVGRLEVVALFTSQPTDVRQVERAVKSGLDARRFGDAVVHRIALEVVR